MAKRVIITAEGKSEVHFSGVLGSDYTLCGLNNDAVGDISMGISAATETLKRVNCTTCIRVVKFCKSIKSTEYTATTNQL